jgi:hypothetical protein
MATYVLIHGTQPGVRLEQLLPPAPGTAQGGSAPAGGER